MATETSLNKVAWYVKENIEEILKLLIEFKRGTIEELHPLVAASGDPLTTRLTNLRNYLLNTYLAFDYNSGDLYYSSADSLYAIMWDDTQLTVANPAIEYATADLADFITRLSQYLPLSPDASFNKYLLDQYITVPDYSTYVTSGSLDIVWPVSGSVTTKTSYYASTGKEIYLISLVDYLTEVMTYLLNNGFVFSLTKDTNPIGYTMHSSPSFSLDTTEAYTSDSEEIYFTIEFYDIYKELITIDLYNLTSFKAAPAITNLGITTKINTNLLARDFETAKQEMISYIGTNYPQVWNDFYDSSIGNVFLDLMAYLHDIVNNYIDRSQRESYPLTAQETPNLVDWVKFLGVEVPGTKSAGLIMTVTTEAVGDLSEVNAGIDLASETGYIKTLTIYPSMDLQNGVTFTLTGPNGLTYNYFPQDNDNTITLTSITAPTEIYIPLIEGELINETFTSTGELFESYTTQQGNVAGTGFIVFDSAGAVLNMVSSYRSFDMSLEADGVYTFLEDGKVQFMFGGNNYGTQLTKGDVISITYLVSNGDKGNELNVNAFIGETIEIEAIQSTDATPSIEVASSSVEWNVKANDSASGGAYVTITPELMPALVGLFQSNNRLITDKDYEYFLKTFEGTQGGKVKSKAFLNIDTNYHNANIIFIPSLIYTANNIYSEFDVYYDTAEDILVYPPIIQEMVDEIDERKMITDRVEIVSGIVQPIEVSIDLVTSVGISKDTVKAQIESDFKEYFNTLPYDEEGRLSDLYYLAEKTLRENDNTYKGMIDSYVTIGWRYYTLYDSSYSGTTPYIASSATALTRDADYYFGQTQGDYDTTSNSQSIYDWSFNYSSNVPIIPLYRTEAGYYTTSTSLPYKEGYWWYVDYNQYNRLVTVFGEDATTDEMRKITALKPIFNWNSRYLLKQKKMIFTNRSRETQ